MISISFTMIAGSILGCLAVIFGAFGAHALKKVMNQEQLKSYETGVKYQMYHALLLLFIGLLPMNDTLLYASRIILIGTLLFSFSIYGLTYSSAKNKKIKLLGPITPIGGLFLVAGWALLFYYFISFKQ